MRSVLRSLLSTLRTTTDSRVALQLELLALRHQLDVLERTRSHRMRLTRTDRWLWVALARWWTGWRTALVIVKPETVIAWHRRGVRRLMTRYCAYYERSRTHLSLDKDEPIPRAVMPPGRGTIVAIPEVGGVHHRYERRAA